jgi:predicted nucleic acid-binding protein
LNELLGQALFIGVTGEIAGVCRDPKDDAILETAWKAGADVLVAGDKDLLSLGSFKGADIITPAEYMRSA